MLHNVTWICRRRKAEKCVDWSQWNYIHYFRIYRGEWEFKKNTVHECIVNRIDHIAVTDAEKMHGFRKSRQQNINILLGSVHLRAGRQMIDCISFLYSFVCSEQQQTIRNRRQVHLLCIVQYVHFVSILFIWKFSRLKLEDDAALNHPPCI